MLTRVSWCNVCRDRADSYPATGISPQNDEQAASTDKGEEICNVCKHRVWYALGNNCHKVGFLFTGTQDFQGGIK